MGRGCSQRGTLWTNILSNPIKRLLVGLMGSIMRDLAITFSPLCRSWNWKQSFFSQLTYNDLEFLLCQLNIARFYSGFQHLFRYNVVGYWMFNCLIVARQDFLGLFLKEMKEKCRKGNMIRSTRLELQNFYFRFASLNLILSNLQQTWPNESNIQSDRRKTSDKREYVI